jgi:hypothetical protein
MKLKKALYKVPIWTNQIAVLMADELISQVKSYNGTKLQRLSAKNIKIPVRMRLGIFALRYVREKYKYLETFKPSLTFK